MGDPGQGWGNALLFVFLSAKVRHKLFTRPLKIVFNRLMLIKSKRNPFFSSGVLQNITPDVKNAIPGSINTPDFVDKQYYVSPSVESSSDYEVISTPESGSRTEPPVTPAMIFNEIL